MVEHHSSAQAGTLTDELLGPGREDGLLVAALAAAVLEFRRHAAAAGGRGHRPAARSAWRTLGRWEQLQGPR